VGGTHQPVSGVPVPRPQWAIIDSERTDFAPAPSAAPIAVAHGVLSSVECIRGMYRWNWWGVAHFLADDTRILLLADDAELSLRCLCVGEQGSSPASRTCLTL
jgi:hypothetical protein